MRPLLLLLLLLACCCALPLPAQQVPGGPRCFPKDFLFGSATAAYQVEGAWNETGRTPSIWDDFCREKHRKLQCADEADDFLHRYQQDIELMHQMGLNSFRLSISWSRLMMWNDATQRMEPNQPGIAFYHDVIDAIRAQNIVPVMTLYHWDLPSALHTELDPPSWLNSGIVDHFVQFAELAFREYGHKVNMWTTFNEPWTFTVLGYGNGVNAPGMKHSRTNTYTAGHNVLLAHAKAVDVFRRLRQERVLHPDAQIGITLNSDFSYPLDPNDPEDVAAAERKMQFVLGWYLSPITTGDYPQIMRERAGDRLPEFTDEEKALVKHSYDVLMLNHYSSRVVTDCHSENSKVSCRKMTSGWQRDLGVDETRVPEGARLSSKNSAGSYNCNWFTGYPKGYLDTIRWMSKHDPTAPILLTENGWCGNEEIENMDQLWYYQNYVKQVYVAMEQYKIPIIGYTAWSFVDNYEWGSFEPRFGLLFVNYTTHRHVKHRSHHHEDDEDETIDMIETKVGDLRRIPRAAARWFSKLATTKCLVDMTLEDKDGAVAPAPPAAVDLAAQPQHNAADILAEATANTQLLVHHVGLAVLAMPIAAGAVMLVMFLKTRRIRRVKRFGERMPLLSVRVVERRKIADD